MSILDFTTGLFHDPANLRAFIDDPDQALHDAGLSDVTPEQVHAFLPVVAESMPPDHPLQAVVHSADPQAALHNLDIDDVCALPPDTKARSDEGGTINIHASGDGASDDRVIVEPAPSGRWKEMAENEKSLGSATDGARSADAEISLVRVGDDPSTPEIEGGIVERNEDHAVNHDLIEPEFRSDVWGKAIE